MGWNLSWNIILSFSTRLYFAWNFHGTWILKGENMGSQKYHMTEKKHPQSKLDLFGLVRAILLRSYFIQLYVKLAWVFALYFPTSIYIWEQQPLCACCSLSWIDLNYRIVASTNTCYYSENQVFGGVTIRVLCSKRGCY